MVKIRGVLVLLFSITVCNLTAQWTKCNLPAGALPYSLVIQGNNIFLGTLSSGVFRSDNGGQSWTEINSNITNKMIWSISIVDNTVFVGTATGGLYRSTDNGNSWIASNSGIVSTTIIKSVVKFNNKFFAASSNKGIYVSDDNGNSWVQHNTGITGLVAATLLTTDTDMFTAVLQAVYKYDSTNQSWIKTSTGIPNNTVSSLAIYNNNSGTKKLFAGISSTVDIFCRSENNANTWTVKQNGLAKVPVATIAIVGSTILVGNDYGVYSTTDFGENWTNTSTGFQLSSYATWLSVSSSSLYVIQGAALWKRNLTDFGITGLKNSTSDSKIILYPNPAKNVLQIQDDISVEKMEIFDLYGKSVYQTIDFNKTINISDLYNGIYFLKIVHKNSTKIIQFIKSN